MIPKECDNFVPICCCVGFLEGGISYCTGENDGIQCSDFDDCLMCQWYGVKGCEYQRKSGDPS